MGSSPSRDIRRRLDHPIVDGDGHFMEVEPVLLDYLKQVAGPDLVKRYVAMLDRGKGFGWHGMNWEQRRGTRLKRPPYWIVPARNTLDRATAMLPALMRSRLDEFGIDFSVMYPTQGILFMSMNDEEMRRAAARAMNIMNAEAFRAHADRLTPAATIPMHTPGEAIEELEYAVKVLGLKAIMLESNIRRPITAPPKDTPALSRAGGTFWIDPLALNSEYDYDPVWRKCIELKVAPTTHSGTQGWPNRSSISSYVYNHIGHFAAAGEVLCKALFLGGVTRRFPQLRFAFLEGGVGWGVMLYHDLISHWEKRNYQALKAHLDPASVDRDLLVELVRRHGDERQCSKVDELRRGDGYYRDPVVERDEDLDEWKSCRNQRGPRCSRPLCPQLLFWLRGGRPHGRVGVQRQG